MIQDLPSDPATLGIRPLVLDNCSQCNGCAIAFHDWPNVVFPPSKMQRIGLGQPDVPIYPCSLVKPAIAEAGVHADEQEILAAKIHEVGKVEAERSVSVIVASNEISIQKHESAAKGSIEFHADTAPGIFFGNIEGPPVPADARLRITTPEWLVAMTLLLFIANERQLNRPVVRQIQGVPFGIVELHRGKFKFTALGEVSLALTEAKIVQRVGAIALEKF